MMNTLADYRYILLEVTRFIDADTIKARIGKDVGFGTFVTWDVKLRLTKVNCPEKGTPGHDEALAFLKEWFSKPGEIIVETAKAQSFDRWYATITRNGECISDLLIENNLGVVYKK